MTKQLKITVEGKVYDVVVEDVTEDAGSTFYQVPSVGMGAPVAAVAPRPAPAAAKPAGPSAGAGDVTAPMGGVIDEVSVREGEAVSAGQQVVVLEAMKMKQTITTDFAGTVKKIYVKAGDTVDANQPLLMVG